MARRWKVGDDIFVLAGVHEGSAGQVTKIRKKRCYFYSEQLRRVVWCSTKHIKVLDPNKAYVVPAGGSMLNAVELTVRRLVHVTDFVG
jgi:hypothetical protein